MEQPQQRCHQSDGSVLHAVPLLLLQLQQGEGQTVTSTLQIQMMEQPQQRCHQSDGSVLRVVQQRQRQM
jgi:hypothetical protein